ncbi:hypothetical protein PQI64_17450 [Shewanella bicestrii]
MLALIIIGLFEKEPLNELVLLPEWGFMSVVLFVATIQKQIFITSRQENGIHLAGMAVNMNSALSLIAAVLFSVALMRSRGYVSFLDWQNYLLAVCNITITSGALLLFASAHIRQFKLEIKYNKSSNADGDKTAAGS